MSDVFPGPTLGGLSFTFISDGYRMWLKRDFEDAEVRLVLSEYGGDKAPRPNGFNFSFLKAVLDFLRSDFCKM